ncbi:PREDICTED: toll-like receptor Tollo [Branchiostoma belcheri]|uniref:Toll-like receptor Tollo n=1 Tax=Branchiostoma belcheri TaxID=7741 RepID=A0A6P5B0H6_BRABE|nr:PREDICTED: toll-like receptor Tollo [Branchiostoma belcheri]
MYVAVRGFSFGLLSVQKLRLPQQSTAHSLALAECGITDIEDFALAAFTELTSLNLDFNNLTRLNQKWFNALKFPNLFKSLSLSHNNISSIDSNCFQKLTTLNVLLLDYNSLQSIGSSWFYNLESLGHLSLKSNLIQSIHPGAFGSLSQLIHLDLSSNALNHLPSETVKRLHKLESLKVSGNKLLSVGDSFLLGMNWSIHRRAYRYSDHRIAVTVNEQLQYSEIPDEYYYKYENMDTSPPETVRTYWQIPDDYYNYYNTRPAFLHQYWEIGDDYYNYENTAGRPLSFPLALQVHLSSGHDDEVQ